VPQYTIRTDAFLADGIDAANVDAAIRQTFADEPGAASVVDVRSLAAWIERIADGAWCWIEEDDTRIVDLRS
jgi:hypothetical protein